MKTKRMRWMGWDVVRCTAGDCEMMVGVSAGPRIVSLRRDGGPNLLYRDHTDFRVGEWRLHGGHRFTVAPEDGRTYEPDNSTCTVEATGIELHVSAAPFADGTIRSMSIKPAPDGAGFDISHILHNRGPRPWTGALWAITCVPSGFPVVAALGNSPLRFWPGTDPAAWRSATGHLVTRSPAPRGKVGWYSETAWMASLRADATFVIEAPDHPARNECVDDGCNLEIFTCPDFTELETLGCAVKLEPGASTVHRQRWRALPRRFATEDWTEIARAAGCALPRAQTVSR